MILADAVHRRPVGCHHPVGEAVPVPALRDRPAGSVDELVEALVGELRVVDPPAPAEDDRAAAVLVDTRPGVAPGRRHVDPVPLAPLRVVRRVPAEDVAALLLGTSLEPVVEVAGV